MLRQNWSLPIRGYEDMNMEGLWYTHFTAGQVQGDGLAVLRDGELLGGDPIHTYSGSYSTDGAQLYVDVRVIPHKSRVDAELERPDSFVLWGSADGETGNVSGCSGNKRDVKIVVDFHRAV
jgi:hypothetical protein